MDACTIIARNYLAQARVLAESFREHHPVGRFTVLVIDGEQPFPKALDDDFEVMVSSELGIEERELHRMMMMYDVMELATAVKPSFLKTLLKQGATDVTYLDPDIEIFAPLDDVSELARSHSIVLTPHVLDPLPHDHREPGEVTLLLAGQFNLGFIAVGHGALPFLDWWAERLRRAGKVDPERGQFVDQRWVDFVPSLFEHAVVRDPGFNVAHWNLVTRRVEVVDGEYRVDGRPLRFFHFSGFDPEKSHLLSKFLGPEPAILLSEEPVLSALCESYAEKLRAAGHAEAKGERYRYDRMANGVRITRRMRDLFGDGVMRAQRGKTEEPPDPFEATTANDVVAWMNEPSHPGAPVMTRFLTDLYNDEPELRERFPNPRWHDGERFLEWMWSTGRERFDVPRELLPVPDKVARERPGLVVGGVNVAGYFRAEAGVGQAGRHILDALRRTPYPFSTVTYGKTKSRQAHAFEETGEANFDLNLVCVNADQLLHFSHDVGPDFFHTRHTIGVWWWELNQFPEKFDRAFDLVSEVWVGSEFIREAVAAQTAKPVLKFPLGIDPPEPAAPDTRRRLGIPDGFVFLFMFDFDSHFERKNPVALVEAFCRAFRPGEGPTLFLKSINGERALANLEAVQSATRGRSDIVIRDEYMSSSDVTALTGAADCYVSLHRSEGFGLTLAEAMGHGKPVIATGYSGNLEFMTESTSHLIPYKLVKVPKGVDPYPAGAQWAEPDVDAAADAMRRVYDDPEAAAELGQRAQAHVADVLSPERTAEFIQERLTEIWRLRGGGPPTGGESPQQSAIERARRYLSEGPTTPIRAPSRFPGGVFARRVVYRLLRPYTARHAEFEHAVVDALAELRAELREHLEHASAAERREHMRLEREIAMLESRLDLERIEELGGSIAAAVSRVEALRQRTEELTRHVARLERQAAGNQQPTSDHAGQQERAPADSVGADR